MAIVLNVIGFQVGWFICVLTAARHQILVGPLVVLAIVGVQLAFHPRRLRELALLATIGLVGGAVETGLGHAGVVALEGHTPPDAWFFLWFASFWINFGAILDRSLRWLQGRPLLAVALGAVGGPPAYYSAAALGAVELPRSAAVTISVLAIYWGIAMPLVMALTVRLGTTTTAAATTTTPATVEGRA